jgi:hypothetical protein
MTNQEREQTLQWIECWRRAGPELEKIRREEIRNADTVAAIEMLSGGFEHARATRPLRSSCGLVEQQRWFSRLRR